MAELKLSEMSAVDLLARMAGAFPDECIRKDEKYEHAMYRAGQRSVVNVYLGMLATDTAGRKQFTELLRRATDE